MNLYVDIGNTNIKIKWKNEIYFFPSNKENTDDVLFNSFSKELQQANPKEVWISSVVPEITITLERITKHFWKSEYRIISYPLKTKIKIDVYDPKSVGSDIVALAAYASSQNSNSIIINMGTATTITHVVNNTIKGVVILPGLKTSFEALIKKASKLHDISLNIPKNKLLGQNTEEAISIGIIKGNVHKLKGFVDEIDKKAIVILSGGNAPIVKKYLNNYNYTKEATLLGIEEISKLHN